MEECPWCNRYVDALELIASLTDTGSDEFIDMWGSQIPPAWNIVEAIREVALEAL